MRVYQLRLVVASANAVSADELFERRRRAWRRSKPADPTNPRIAASQRKATVLGVTSVDAVPDNARAWLLAAMRHVGKRRPSDLVEDRRNVG